jgi:hypothetical protein
MLNAPPGTEIISPLSPEEALAGVVAVGGGLSVCVACAGTGEAVGWALASVGDAAEVGCALASVGAGVEVGAAGVLVRAARVGVGGGGTRVGVPSNAGAMISGVGVGTLEVGVTTLKSSIPPGTSTAQEAIRKSIMLTSDHFSSKRMLELSPYSNLPKICRDVGD